ncbi:hypothetical protein ACFSF3_06440 [Vibrio chagasii]
MKKRKTLTRSAFAAALITLIGCSSEPNRLSQQQAVELDLSDQTRFKLFKEYSQIRQYNAFTNIDVDPVNGMAIEKIETREAYVDSSKTYLDTHEKVGKYCIEEIVKLDGFVEGDDGFVFPAYTKTKQLVECPSWTLYKSLYGINTPDELGKTTLNKDGMAVKPQVDDRTEVN